MVILSSQLMQKTEQGHRTAITRDVRVKELGKK